MCDSRPLDFDLLRQTWTEALALTNGLPATVPCRAEVDRLTGYLRGAVEVLVAELEAAIEGQPEDTSDRETARWLLIRTRKALDEGPGLNHRTAAVHVEDLALTCRALVTLCRQQLSEPVLSG
ncbi:DUF6415 family natural product biosynthesis protein [Streptomyces fulvoviolaceus]|uniref:DUF6415 family natural product biosynthesis protein n=1 Tax=Streptomyces fulvoviolaceus TaxID=285535 RepID=UPI0021C0C1DB|nr:DUF6415 family natural product biosynthesis protein [Streptomyces fulvoviolaceus]MCT9080295.1 DUF6415 family natural product biosynthesis protein [Streptomyces fulvoviolaceus]